MFKTKRQNVLSTLLLSTALLLSSNIQAQWIESSGSAEVRRGGKELARNQAVQNAIKDALLFAGASISSVAQVSDGLLTQDQFKISSHGSIRQLELIDELHHGGMISVTIRADIVPGEEKQCLSADFKKSIAVTQLSVVNREQAKIGRLYDIGKSFSKRLYELMHRDSKSILPRPWYRQKIGNQTSFEQYYDSNLNVIDTIGRSTESQFVLLGRINDMSFGEQTNSTLAFWQKPVAERFFTIDIMLYNSNTKEQVFRQQFDAVGDWDISNRRVVDVNSRKFWESDYGNAIDELIEQAKTSIEDIVFCQPLQGKIVKVDNNRIQFNIGENHGVAKGQVFNIIHQAHFTNHDGKYLPQFVISPYLVEVVDVYTRTAIAKSVGDELLGNIQTSDHVILQETTLTAIGNLE